MVEPVVVMPEIDSNSASVKLSPKSEKRNGSAPNIPDNTQAEFVSRNASLRPKFSSCLLRLVNQRDIPTKQDIKAADANPNQFWYPNEISTSIGISMVADKIVPLKRLCKTDDIINLANFLCSDKSSYITGQNIVLDGGLSLLGQETVARKFI